MVGGEAAAARDHLGCGLHLDLEPRQGRCAVDDELVVGRQLVDGEQGPLDLGGIEVDALDDEHVIRTPLDARHSRRGAAAAARLEAQGRDVAGTVTNERHRPLGQRGEDELPFPAGRQHGARNRIDDLREEVIVGDVEAVARLALAGDAGPDDLRQTIDVERADAERPLERDPDAVGPGLGAEQSDAEPELARLPALFGQGLGQVQREGRRARENVRLEVLQQEMVARRVTRGDRHDGHADTLGTVVEAEPSREEAVAEGDVQQVAAARARGRQRARHDLPPDVEVAGRVGGDSRLAFGAGGGMDPGDLSPGHGEQAERILLAEVRLADERKAREIGERADPSAAQPLTVKRHVLADPAERFLEPVELQLLARRSRHALGGGVPDQRERRGGSGNCWSTIRWWRRPSASRWITRASRT